MKICLTVLALLSLIVADLSAATIGPDVAVMDVRVGKEKESRRVVIGLYDSTTPLTVANFKELVGNNFYRGLRFHRIFPGSLVQTGDPKSRHGEADRSGTGGPGYTIPAEIGLKHIRGAVAMSRLSDTVNPARASNGSQFYVCLTEMPKLNGKYTVFGEILEGMDVLEAISNEQTDSNDFPLAKIEIKSMVIQPRFAPSTSE